MKHVIVDWYEHYPFFELKESPEPAPQNRWTFEMPDEFFVEYVKLVERLGEMQEEIERMTNW